MKRRRVFLAIFSALLLSASPLGVWAESARTTADLNLRTGPGMNYSVVDVISEGVMVDVQEDLGEWCKVKLSSGTTGYMHGDYLEFGGQSGPSESVSESYVTTADVNMRTGKGTGYSVILTVDEGTKITVIDKSDSTWYGVRLSDGRKGYMHTDYIQAAGSSGGSGSSGPSETVSEAYVTTADVNMRTGRGTGYSVILTVDEGTKITVIDKSNSTWYGVRLSDGRKGYMHTDYIRPSGGSGGSGPSETVSEAYVTTADVNMRTGRGTGYSVILTVDEGTKITVIDKSNSTWYGVRLSDGRKGYMHTDYIRPSGGSGGSGPSESVSESYVTTADVNMRTGRGTGYSVILTVDEGTKITVIDKSNSTWYGVRLSDGRKGYMHTDYIRPSGGSGGSGPSESVSEPYFTTADVCLRSGRSTSHSVITVIDEGVQVTVVDKSDSQWYGVKLSNGTKGYVYSEYLAAVTGKHISGVPYINQMQKYPNGCESVSAVMALRYAGVDISVERFIDSYLPMGDTPYWGSKGMTGSNPWKEFLGSPYSSDGWGCYAPPIASAMRSIAPGYTVDEMYGVSLEELCHSYIDNDIPVIIWGTIDMASPGRGTSWTAYDGEKITWIYPMHSLLLIGYDDDYYYFNDSMNSANTRYPKSAVNRSYQALYSQAIAVY